MNPSMCTRLIAVIFCAGYFISVDLSAAEPRVEPKRMSKQHDTPTTVPNDVLNPCGDSLPIAVTCKEINIQYSTADEERCLVCTSICMDSDGSLFLESQTECERSGELGLMD